MKGQGMPAYDPRAIKGIGIPHATSSMGADHTAGHTMLMPVKDHLKEGQVEASRQTQKFQAVIDTLGRCSFARVVVQDQKELLVGLLEAVHGVKIGVDELLEIGEKVLDEERSFNLKAGIGPEKDRLPEFMYMEELPPWNVVFDFTAEDLTEPSEEGL